MVVSKKPIPSANTSFELFKKQAMENAERVGLVSHSACCLAPLHAVSQPSYTYPYCYVYAYILSLLSLSLAHTHTHTHACTHTHTHTHTHIHRSDWPSSKKSNENSSGNSSRVRPNFRERGRRGPVSPSRGKRRTQKPESWQKESDARKSSGDEERL